MNRDLISKLFIAGLLGFGIGMIYNNVFHALLMNRPDLNLGLFHWPFVIIMFICGIPFFLTIPIFALFGYSVFEYIKWGLLVSLIFYIGLPVLGYYFYWRLFKK